MLPDQKIPIMPPTLPPLPDSHQPRNVPFLGHWASLWAGKGGTGKPPRPNARPFAFTPGPVLPGNSRLSLAGPWLPEC